MRRSALVLLLSLGSLARADRAVTTPVARPLPEGAVRYELSLEMPQDATTHRIGVGLGAGFDAELRLGRDPTGDVNYNVVAALPGFGPGLSFGITDVADVTDFGRQFYLVFTNREAFYTASGEAPGEISLGTRFGKKRSGLFVSAQVPILRELSFVTEHDGKTLVAGIGLKVGREGLLRWVLSENRSLLSAQFTRRF